jgi:BASS family bile acid:Na+ symporter
MAQNSDAMSPVIDIAIPVLTFLMMVTVGHGLTATELRRSATDIRASVTATVGQLVLLPLIATVIILVLRPSPAITAGLILVAASPGGAISNFYAHLVRANTALSVTLTAISCLVSFAAIPALVAAGFFFWLENQPDIEVPFATLTVQLLVLVALPVFLGMILRRWRPTTTETRDRFLQRLCLVALVALVSWIVKDLWHAIIASFSELLLASALFTLLAMAAGFSIAWATGRPAADRLTYLIEFPCRNLALALMVAITGLHRPDFVPFATVLFLTQVLVMLSAAAFLRRERPVG